MRLVLKLEDAILKVKLSKYIVECLDISLRGIDLPQRTIFRVISPFLGTLRASLIFVLNHCRWRASVRGERARNEG